MYSVAGCRRMQLRLISPRDADSVSSLFIYPADDIPTYSISYVTNTTSLPDLSNARIITLHDLNAVCCQVWTSFCFLLKMCRDISQPAQATHPLITFHWLPLENSTLWGCKSKRASGLNLACVSPFVDFQMLKYSQYSFVEVEEDAYPELVGGKLGLYCAVTVCVCVSNW